jgi:hypothetical protein
VVALGALAVGALSIAVTLAASDADKWPGWLQPYHRWGWWSVLGLLVAAVVLAVWQVTRATSSPSPGTATAQGTESGPVAGRDVTITGGQAPTVSRDIRTTSGSSGFTAGRDLITIITSPRSTPLPGPEPAEIPGTRGDVNPDVTETNPPTVEEDLKALEELKPLLHESVYVRFQERIVTRRFPHLRS